jgi:hypothetical protein
MVGAALCNAPLSCVVVLANHPNVLPASSVLPVSFCKLVHFDYWPWKFSQMALRRSAEWLQNSGQPHQSSTHHLPEQQQLHHTRCC